MSRCLVFTFSAVVSFSCCAQQLQRIQSLQAAAGENNPLIADVNGDGLMDSLVASSESGQLDVWLGQGRAELTHHKTYGVGSKPTSLAAADFNKDGITDVVVANHEEQHVSVLMGEANGVFGKPKQIEISVLPHPHVVAAADINADGHIDIAVDNRDQFGLVVLYGDGTGNFTSPGTLIPVQGAPYLGFALGDINNDDLIDVVTPNANSISVLTNNQNKDFTLQQSINMPSVFSVALTDFNNDQNLDLIAASQNGAVHVYLGNGQGQFTSDDAMTIQMRTGAKLLTTGDFDGDGSGDAVVSNWNGGVRVLRFSDQKVLESLPLDTGNITTPWGLAAGDLNNDGRDDIVLADGEKSVLHIYSIAE